MNITRFSPNRSSGCFDDHKVFNFQTTRWIILSLVILCLSCKKSDTDPLPSKNISYQWDGRMVKLGDPSPLIIDLNIDGEADYTVFVELTANSTGDHLYTGINPIGANLIKSGPPDDNRFLNMGFLVAEPTNALVHYELQSDHRWTSDHSALAIRNTNSDGTIWHEGDWGNNSSRVVGIQHISNGKSYFGWLRLKFDHSTEVVTLIDYAYEQTANQPIKAGDF